MATTLTIDGTDYSLADSTSVAEVRDLLDRAFRGEPSGGPSTFRLSDGSELFVRWSGVSTAVLRDDADSLYPHAG